MPKTFLIIGAGLGGLATALRLADRGERVIVLEKTDVVGGRDRRVQVNDCHFDGGPTFVMMLAPFLKVFTDVGERLEDHLELTKCDPSYRVFYADGVRLDATTDVEAMVRQIRAISGDEDAAAYPRMLEDLAAMYEDAIPNFVEKNFYRPQDFFGGKALGLVRKHRMLGKLAAGVARYVRDEHLQMLFSFQTMYLGLSPYQAPWVYAVLTHMEYGEGIFYTKGGMPQIAEVLRDLARKRGAEIRFNSEVEAIAGRTVRLKSGEVLNGDVVICNADLPYAERELIERPKRARKHRHSCSALTMYIDYEGELPQLLHHNVFFGLDFVENLKEIFMRSEIPIDPAFYAAVSARTEPARAVPGHENLYILVPVPNLDHPWQDADRLVLQQRIFQRLVREVGFDASRVRGISFCTPEDWRRDLNLDKGAAFGLSHDFWQSAYFRPTNRCRSNPDLYFVGASTVPGNGMPMVLISADLVVQRLEHDGYL